MLSAAGFGIKREPEHAVIERPLITPKTLQPAPSDVLVGVSSSLASRYEPEVDGGTAERARSLRVLVVDDDPSVRSACCEIAAKIGYVVTSAGDVPEARVLLKRHTIDILLMDLKLPGEGGLSLLEEMKSQYPNTSVVVMTAFATVDSAVEMMQNGAGNYLSKPFALERLTKVLEKAGAARHVELESRSLRERLRTEKGMGDLIGRSPEMEKLYRMMSKVVASTHPVLIVGESGTGKELVARSIHKNGPNALKPFVAVDCRATVPTLMESKLFGYVKGAFTGANRDKTGLLGAESGTVFLDEVGELPLDLQAKLLRALQEKEVRPIGAAKAVPVQVRVLAATDRNLISMVEQGKFRKDLYYRLNVVNLKVPSLRERRDDIPMLADHFLEQQKVDPDKKFRFSEEVLHLLVAYDWPGNVRELAHAVEHLCEISSGPMLETIDTPSPIKAFSSRAEAHALATTVPEQSLLQTHVGAIVPTPPPAGVVSIADLEKNAILVTIQQLKGDKLMAAKLLGIGKTTLYRKLKEYGIAE